MVPQVVINTVVGIGKQHIFVFEKKKKRKCFWAKGKETSFSRDEESRLAAGKDDRNKLRSIYGNTWSSFFSFFTCTVAHP